MDFPITGDMIRLGQLLKAADVVSSGAEVKDLLAQDIITVNGEAENRRGRQLTRGDVVRVADEDEITVV